MKKIFSLILLGGLVFAGCKKQETTSMSGGGDMQHDNAMDDDQDFNNKHKRLRLRTLVELLQVRAATAKYRSFQKAMDDGYEDIHVRMENMGFHFMKTAIVDSVFDLRHPEILVYNKRPNGSYELVAVEYAVPLDKSVNAPAGFTGDNDVWDHNVGFGLWLLHAWVWKFNPDGVFHPTNPTVHVPL